MQPQISHSEFQPRVFAAYCGLHGVLASQTSPGDRTAGVLAGLLVVSNSVAGGAEALPLAAAISGAAFLGIESDEEAARTMLRFGRCDFVVNTLDEALRILKNEVRQHKPVSVVLAADADDTLRAMAERGVAPNLIVHQSSGVPSPLQTMAAWGATLATEEDLERRQDCDTPAGCEPAHWTLPYGTAAMLARMDVVAAALLPADASMRRRWLEAAPRFLPRETPPRRVFALTSGEQERFLDAISARLMSGDLIGPVELEFAGRQMVLGAEPAT